MPSRDKNVTDAYDEYKKNPPKECPFCVLGTREVLGHYSGFVILRALFPYVQWDEKQVFEHLMVVPTRHIERLSELKYDESKMLLEILSQYEENGYSIYARAPQDATRSVVHQHTHLLLLEH